MTLTELHSRLKTALVAAPYVGIQMSRRRTEAHGLATCGLLVTTSQTVRCGEAQYMLSIRQPVLHADEYRDTDYFTVRILMARVPGVVSQRMFIVLHSRDMPAASVVEYVCHHLVRIQEQSGPAGRICASTAIISRLTNNVLPRLHAAARRIVYAS